MTYAAPALPKLSQPQRTAGRSRIAAVEHLKSRCNAENGRLEPIAPDAAMRTNVCYRRYAKNVPELLRFWKGFLTAEIGVFYARVKKERFWNKRKVGCADKPAIQIFADFATGNCSR